MSNESMKPMTVARYEFVQNLTGLINNSMLPPFVIEDVLKDIQNKVSVMARQQLENDLKKYNDGKGSSPKSDA